MLIVLLIIIFLIFGYFYFQVKSVKDLSNIDLFIEVKGHESRILCVENKNNPCKYTKLNFLADLLTNNYDCLNEKKICVRFLDENDVYKKPSGSEEEMISELLKQLKVSNRMIIWPKSSGNKAMPDWVDTIK